MSDLRTNFGADFASKVIEKYHSQMGTSAHGSWYRSWIINKEGLPNTIPQKIYAGIRGTSSGETMQALRELRRRTLHGPTIQGLAVIKGAVDFRFDFSHLAI